MLATTRTFMIITINNRHVVTTTTAYTRPILFLLFLEKKVLFSKHYHTNLNTIMSITFLCSVYFIYYNLFNFINNAHLFMYKCAYCKQAPDLIYLMIKTPTQIHHILGIDIRDPYKYTYIQVYENISIKKVLYGPPNNFFFGKCFKKKLLNIFSNFFSYLKV